ncbi:SDR family NAD(P)-dependent oxidoreductase [Sphingomonas cavernae]|uniref:SDR family NAD(P)-dependent oxidoreductase n=1 Tax=Sphingomonas cavernae TaxID=2320861 RepID=A0A418WMY3_9SPHN|nr:SDR family NAD(P)-dependent oxidoreductase [Sphingomonas cavernae]RJF91361.1 SDR family NAD(P)-dependent oxidoreductase [Sphingomonas cavernae]
MNGTAVVVGASEGIGAAIEAALIDEGAHGKVYGFARDRAGPERIDSLDEASIAAAAAHVGAGPAPSLVVIATDTGGVDHPSIADISREALERAFAINAIGPALVAKHFLPLLPTTGTPLLVMISGRDGSITDNRLGGGYARRASRAALTMLVKTLAIESTRAARRAVIVAIDPGNPADPERAALQILDGIEALGVRDSGKFLSWDGTEIAP